MKITKKFKQSSSSNERLLYYMKFGFTEHALHDENNFINLMAQIFLPVSSLHKYSINRLDKIMYFMENFEELEDIINLCEDNNMINVFSWCINNNGGYDGESGVYADYIELLKECNLCDEKKLLEAEQKFKIKTKMKKPDKRRVYGIKKSDKNNLDKNVRILAYNKFGYDEKALTDKSKDIRIEAYKALGKEEEMIYDDMDEVRWIGFEKFGCTIDALENTTPNNFRKALRYFRDTSELLGAKGFIKYEFNPDEAELLRINGFKVNNKIIKGE